MEGKTTIISNSIDTVLFDDRGVWVLDRTSLQSDLQLEEGDDFVWCLYDGVDPPVSAFFSVHCFLVHVTSPEVSRYKEWTKQVGAKTWYMDVWTKAEFRERCAACAPFSFTHFFNKNSQHEAAWRRV